MIEGDPLPLCNLTDHRGLASPINDRADHLSRQLPVGELEVVGHDVVDPELGCDGVGHGREPAGDHGRPHPGPLQRADKGPCPRCQPDAPRHPCDGIGVETLQQGDPLAEGLGEIDVPLHGLPCDLDHPIGHPGLLREQIDGLVLDQGGVDIDDHKTFGSTFQGALLHGDVDTTGRGRPPQPGAEIIEIAPVDGHLVGDDRVSGESLDTVDVPPTLRHGLGYGTEGLRPHLGGDHGHHRRLATPTTWGLLQRVEIDIETLFPAEEEQILHRRPVRRDREHDIKCQPSPDHHLLDVVDVGPRLGEHSHEAGGDPGTVGSRHPHQNRSLSGH